GAVLDQDVADSNAAGERAGHDRRGRDAAPGFVRRRSGSIGPNPRDLDGERVLVGLDRAGEHRARALAMTAACEGACPIERARFLRLTAVAALAGLAGTALITDPAVAQSVGSIAPA